MADNDKKVWSTEEKQKVIELFNSFEGGYFKTLVTASGHDRNAEKRDAWDRFTAAYQSVSVFE